MRYNQSVIIDPRKILPSRHSIFIRGFPGTIKLEDVKDLFSKQADEKCKIDFFSYSDDKSQLFLALRFESHLVARKIIEKYDGERLLGHRVEISWFKDIRKARKKVIENEHKYHGLLASYDNRRRPYGRFSIRRPPMGARRFGNPPPTRYYGSSVARQRVSSSNSSESDSHSSSGSENSRRSRRIRRRCSPRRVRRSSSYSSHSSGPRRRRFLPPTRRVFNRSPRSLSRRSRSPSSSSFSSASPSRRSVAQKSAYQYDLHTEEKEILQAALAACSSPRARVSTQERSASETSRKRSPRRGDLGPVNSPEQHSPTAEPSSPSSPKRKREKRSKKHSRGRRHGKRKRRDLEEDDESPRPKTPPVEMDEEQGFDTTKPNGYVEPDNPVIGDSQFEARPDETATAEDFSQGNLGLSNKWNEPTEPEGNFSSFIANEQEMSQPEDSELPIMYDQSVPGGRELSAGSNTETTIFPAGKFKPISEIIHINLDSPQPARSWLYSPTEKFEVKLKSAKSKTVTPSSLPRLDDTLQFEDESPFVVTPSKQQKPQQQQQQQLEQQPEQVQQEEGQVEQLQQEENQLEQTQREENQLEQKQQQEEGQLEQLQRPTSSPVTMQSPSSPLSPPSATQIEQSPPPQLVRYESEPEQHHSQNELTGTEVTEDLPSMELDSPESPEQSETVTEKQNQVDMATQTMFTNNDHKEDMNPLMFSFLSDQKLDEIFQRKRLIEAAYRLDCESYTNSITNLIRVLPSLSFL